MKKLLLTSVALMGLTATAMAADLPRRVAPAPLPIPVAPLFSWTGFYVGVNAGYGFSTRDDDCDYDYGYGYGLGYGGCGNFNAHQLTVPSVFGGLGTQPISIVGGFPSLGTGYYNDDRRHDGFVGGGQIGYNYQFTPGSGFVIGLEADAQYAGFGRNRDDDNFYGLGGFGGFGTGFNNGLVTATPAPTPFVGVGVGVVPGTGVLGVGTNNVALFNNFHGWGNNNNHSSIEWFGTVRGRLGYAVDRLLLYVTGGLAFTDRRDNNNNNFYGYNFGFASGAAVATTVPAFFAGGAALAAGSLVTPTALVPYVNDRGNNIGWTVGGGIEYAFTPNWTVKLEGLYVSFDNDKRNNNYGYYADHVVGVSNTGAPVYKSQLGGYGYGYDNKRNNNDFAVVRVGINYLFSTPAPVAIAPVAARY